MRDKIDRYELKVVSTGEVIGRYHSKKRVAMEGMGFTQSYLLQLLNKEDNTFKFKGVLYKIELIGKLERWVLKCDGEEDRYYTGILKLLRDLGCSSAWYYNHLDKETLTLKFKGKTYTIIDTLKQ